MSAMLRYSTRALRFAQPTINTLRLTSVCSFHSTRSLFSEQKQVDPLVEEIVDKITTLNLIQVSELNTLLKEKLNLPDHMIGGGMPMMMAAPTEAAEAPVEEEK